MDTIKLATCITRQQELGKGSCIKQFVQYMINMYHLTHVILVILELLLLHQLSVMLFRNHTGELMSNIRELFARVLDLVGPPVERNNLNLYPSMNIPSKLNLFLLQAYRLIILRPSCKKRFCLLLMTAMFFLASSVLQEEKTVGLLPVNFW